MLLSLYLGVDVVMDATQTDTQARRTADGNPWREAGGITSAFHPIRQSSIKISSRFKFIHARKFLLGTALILQKMKMKAIIDKNRVWEKPTYRVVGAPKR